MKKLFSILLTAVTLISFSQQKEINWKLYKNIKGIEIYYKYQECHDVHNGIHQELVLFKFANKTDNDVKIEFDFALVYTNLKSSSSRNLEQHRQILLKKKSIYESSCYKNREYTIFSKFLNYSDKSELQWFELKNMKITTTKL